MGEKVYPDVSRVYLDMDGVLADFDRECEYEGVTPNVLKRRAGTYRELDIIPGALVAVNDIERFGFDVFILTKIPDANPYAATEKLLWVREHFPQLSTKVIITPDKGAVGTKRDILIDDHPEWANANNFPGTVIKFEGNWKRIIGDLAAHRLMMAGVFK